MLSLKKPEDRKLVDSLLGVERIEIIGILLRSQPMYLTEIARESKMDRTTLAYHLEILEKVGILTSEYKVLTEAGVKGKAARFYSVNTSKLSEVLEVMDEVKGLLPPHRLVTRN